MATRVKLIEVILTKIEQIYDHQLEDVLGYVEKIEQMNDQKKHILVERYRCRPFFGTN